MKKDKQSNEQNIWSKGSIEFIITELRKRKTLYDQQHPDYLNRTKRQLCLENICKALFDKLGLKVTVEALKNKIQIIRAQFNKDLRCMLRNKKYKPKFWCFKKMEWLKPYCNNRYNVPALCESQNSHSKNNAIDFDDSRASVTISKNGDGVNQKTQAQSDMTSTTTFDDNAAMSSSSILTSKLVETVLEEPTNDSYNMNRDLEEDFNEQFFETIALTQQMVQNRIAAKELRAQNGKLRNQNSSWEGELVKSQLDLISDETIRSDTMWEIQCVLRRGIEQDRVLPKRRRRNNRKLSLDNSELSVNGSYISLNSNDSLEEADDMNNGE